MNIGQLIRQDTDLSQFVINSKAEIVKDIHGNDCFCPEGKYWTVEYDGKFYAACVGHNAFEAKECAYRKLMERDEE